MIADSIYGWIGLGNSGGYKTSGNNTGAAFNLNFNILIYD